ncbi:MAG: SpoIIE family protein phosphatase [Bacteroidia bacterium]|nr:SpoIIE family protein phosphatase [Bacteroidia bacterium]
MPFTQQEIQLQTGDTIYLFSDGYADQFGGEKGKKFTYQRFKDLLLSVQDKSMEEQKQILDETIEKWKGEQEQIDDICVIGVRV